MLSLAPWLATQESTKGRGSRSRSHSGATTGVCGS